MQTIIDERNRTFWIKDGEAYINGYTYDGEVFMVFVPVDRRRKGVAKRLISAAEKLMLDYGHSRLGFTSPTSPEGKAMLAWYSQSSQNRIAASDQTPATYAENDGSPDEIANGRAEWN